VSEAGTTRRQLLARSVAAGGVAGALLAAPADATTEPDRELLVPLVGTEMLAVLVYGRAIASGLLSPVGEQLGRELLAQEQAHLAAISRRLTRLGGTPPPPLTKVSDAEKVLSAHRIPGSLSDLHDEHDTIILLAEVEFLLEDTYRSAISKLSDPGAIGLCAATMAAEAQHGVALSELLHPGDVKKAVPSPFV